MDKQIIQRGAEAVLYLDEIDGQTVVVKERIKKNYRIKQIDEKLRKERTHHESKLLTDARSIGVATPQILKVDDKKHSITMEFIEGERLKEFLMHAEREEIEQVCQKVGESIAKLHDSHITHGDLTTSNIIKGDKIYFIDFGLGSYSKRIEDKGMDLRLLHDAIKAAHYNILKVCWRNILIGYRKEYKEAENVINKIEEIQGRTRYAKRDKKTEEPERE